MLSLTAFEHVINFSEMSQKAVLVGAGNVATQLGLTMSKAGYSIGMVISKTSKSSALLAKKLKCRHSTNLNDIPFDTEIIIIAVNDDAIEQVAKKIKHKNALVIHTSGTTEIGVLKKTFENCGVLYPLQTFSKDIAIDLTSTPILIEGNTKKNTATLTAFAKNISQHIVFSDSKKRKEIHLAAVFACNFSNYMYSIANTILKKQKLDISILSPLIEETTKKALKGNPELQQTGPAKRNDKITLKIHLDLLKKNKDYQHIYKMLSLSIVKKYKK